jgi:DMSO/TMAO reductase YedYZ molybdopterin-dependent catalytic subunit
MSQKDRVPPGQYLTEKWPVLHAGTVPRIDLETWNFRIFGLVDEEKVLNWAQFMSLPKYESTSDIHCVTTWSRLDNRWDGVSFRDVMSLVQVKPEAKFVVIHAEEGWTTNLPLTDLLMNDVLFAHSHNGEALTPNHGWPLRLVVPQLYFWKSAKWVRGIEFVEEDLPGFWEERGYHLYADPWLEQRYRDDPEWHTGEKNTDEYYERVARRIRLHEQKKQQQAKGTEK